MAIDRTATHGNRKQPSMKVGTSTSSLIVNSNIFVDSRKALKWKLTEPTLEIRPNRGTLTLG